VLVVTATTTRMRSSRPARWKSRTLPTPME
jgi:hypothetical protein